MALLRRPTLLLVFFPMIFSTIAIRSVFGEEEFSEDLLLKPLPDRKVLAHFHFETKTTLTKSYGRHHHLFPKAISQLVRKYHVRAMELSFTQGRWNYGRWGGFDPISSRNAKPPGVELWAVFDVPQDQIDASWKNLTHSLSGLFCASINFLESSTSYSAPEWGFPPALGSLKYGTLPREAVCTENLTPWLKLLPCRDKAGLSALLDRPSIYRGFYHSQRLRLTTSDSGSGGIDSQIVLEQSLTIVLQPNFQGASTTYASVTNVQPSCLRGVLFAELENLCKDNFISGLNDIDPDGLRTNPGFELSIGPDRVHNEVNSLHNKGLSIVYEYSVEKHSNTEPFDLGLNWKLPVVWSSPQAPLHASRFLMGSGNERGAIAISLKSTELSEGFLDADIVDERCKLQVDVFQVVPWYIKVYYHTLQLFVDEHPQAVKDFVERIHVSPSEDKESPGVMELVLKLPCDVKSAALTLEFDKGFLHIDEYPPDANQGFDIPSAIISFPDFHSRMQFHDNSLSKSPIISKFQEKSPALSYTEVLLVPLTTPDFSMPYNVLTITCTVFALYFGSLLNVLRRRVEEEERYLTSEANRIRLVPWRLSKLFAKLRGRPWESPQPPLSASSSFSPKLIL
ncbi:GPI transamidase component PIG-T [Quillaja saponaria]|uniref:GPI transamidase component PIG-T n=1 Tax=Quillaja saponaria TaxID=32244 RepID=A0AAD7PMS6_QUISA|nr:GPI transamidase component PIG-T [Quillaja saponaria]